MSTLHILVLITALLSVHQTKATTFYIGSECMGNEPCYALHQLNETLLSDRGRVVLLLLPETHVLDHSVMTTNVSELIIRPLIEGEMTEIKCHLDNVTSIQIRDINQLNVSFVYFDSCILDWKRINNALASNCFFTSKRHDFEKVLSQHALHVVLVGLQLTWCQFVGNRAGGAISMDSSNVTVDNCIFKDNFAHQGGAIRMSEQSAVQIHGSTFSNNQAKQGGGAITAVHGKNVILNKFLMPSATTFITIFNSTFMNNSALSGGAIDCTESKITIHTSIFRNNHAQKAGGAMVFLESVANIYSSEFCRNYGEVGGAIFIFISFIVPPKTMTITQTNFTSNKATVTGGAIHYEGSWFVHSNNSDLIIRQGEAKNNSAGKNGGFSFVRNCKLAFVENHNAISNSAQSVGGAVYVYHSLIKYRDGNFTLSGNTAEQSGGAIFMYSTFLTCEHSVVFFTNNTVTSEYGKGGAIFVDDGYCDREELCFNNAWILQNATTHACIFSKNRASVGSALYGGLLDHCGGETKPSGIENFRRMSDFESPLDVTSEPLKICICNDSEPNCDQHKVNFAKARGEDIAVKVVALGQNRNKVPAIITASFQQNARTHLGSGESSRSISANCTDLKYHVFTAESTDEVILTLDPLENPCRGSPLSVFNIHVKLLACPRGFEQRENMTSCTCDRRLITQFNNLDTDCDIADQSILRKGPNWLSYTEEKLKTASSCTLGYCQDTDKTISLSSPDSQCANSRRGVLCGGCQGNHSVALGGNKCLDCTSHYTFLWLVVMLAVAGLALVALLLVCNITVSAGTLNGLIFYANVISTSGLLSTLKCSVSPILSVFIAWLNLDLGVETCFYSGMDTYHKTWLQFVFPLYTWLLVGAIIVASYYSSRAMRLFGSNSIAILATLFLLSYSKLLKTIITALSFTQVWQGMADNVTDQLVPYSVWMYDGNVEYLKGRHIALFVVALLVLVLLFLPYTLLLLFGQCIRSMSVRRCPCLSRLTRSTAFVSVMDAYHAPYQKRHRYWTGLMLLTRCALLLVFATSRADDALLTNMFTTALFILGIVIVKTCIVKIYRKSFVDFLELSFLMNLGILSSTLYYLKGKGDVDEVLCKTTSASISVGLIVFIGILAYHACLQIAKTIRFYKRALTREERASAEVEFQELMDDVDFSNKPPTSTTIDIRDLINSEPAH